ncbi:hypothetical protein ACSBR1_027134 [Camellia fascicularis]
MLHRRLRHRLWKQFLKVVEFTLALQETGCFSVVLECVFAPVAAATTSALQIPTIDLHQSGESLELDPMTKQGNQGNSAQC